MVFEFPYKRIFQYFIAIFIFQVGPSWHAAHANESVCSRSLIENSQAYKSGQVFLSAEQTKFHIGETIKLYAGIWNTRDDDIFVYKNVAWGYGGGFILHLKDDMGKEITPKAMDDTMLPPPSDLSDKGIFFELKAGEIFGLTHMLTLENRINSAGHYSFQVEYRSPLSCSIVGPTLKRLPALWREGPSLWSNTLYIDITR